MDKKEFLDILGQTLKGEVSSDVILQNINYYDQYITAQTEEEELKRIEMLGDPRLIAKTVIETDKAASHKNGYQEGYSSNSGSGRYADKEEGNQNNKGRRNNTFYTNLTWIQKLTLILVLIVILFILIFVGRIIIGILFTFLVPILLILLLYALFKKRN